MVQGSQALRKVLPGPRLLHTVAGFIIDNDVLRVDHLAKKWWLDIKQGYTRIRPTIRLLHVTPDHAFCIPQEIFSVIMHPVYGRVHAGDAWWRTLRMYLMQKLGLIQCMSEPCLFKIQSSIPTSFLGVYVDDIIFVEGDKMRRVVDCIGAIFPGKGIVDLPFLFSGCNIDESDSMLQIQQMDYSQSVTGLSSKYGFGCLTRLRYKLASLALTQPDILTTVNILAEVKEKTFNPTHVNS